MLRISIAIRKLLERIGVIKIIDEPIVRPTPVNPTPVKPRPDIEPPKPVKPKVEDK